MPSSKTYTQNINRSKLQLKTIFKPKKTEKEDTVDEKPVTIPKKGASHREDARSSSVFTRIEPKLGKVEKKVESSIPKTIDTSQNIHEKRTLIFKIQKYQNSERFGSFVRHNLHITQSESQLNKLDFDGLNDILAKIRIQLDNRNLDEFYNAMIKGGAAMMETVLQSYYNIDGYADNLIANKQFMDSLERMKIENPLPSVSPSIQISYALISTAIMTHQMNKMNLNIPKDLKMDLNEPQTEMEPPNIEEMDEELQKEFQNEFLGMLKKSLDEKLVESESESLSTIEEGSEEEPSEEASEVGSQEADEDEKAEEVVEVGAKL